MKNLVFILVILSFVSTSIAGCGPSTPPTLAPAIATERAQHSVGAFESGKYRNLFAEYLGKSDADAKARVDAAWNQLFYGDDNNERVYYPFGDDMAYIVDTGNNDVRSEGMSYGMMVAVQLDKKEEFDRLWKWAKTYMYQSGGWYKGYFAWHCSLSGIPLDANPASDGEEWFAMALLFASARWGDGEGIFNYRKQAQEILDVMLHKKDEDNGVATNMFDPMQKMVVFVPTVGAPSGFSDPSYHLPAYYELWARWAARDNQFWLDATQTSRAYFKKAANPKTGLMPDYAQFNGTPYNFGAPGHQDFRFDAFRTLSNVAVDYAWWAVDPWQIDQSNRVLSFLASQGMDSYPNQYTVEGKPLTTERSTALTSMAAVAALAADRQVGEPFVQVLWDTQIPSGKYRYYDGLLYLLAMMHVSGNFRIYTPN